MKSAQRGTIMLAQEQRLRSIWEMDPAKCLWNCYPGGIIKDKTLLALRDAALIECSYLYGNSMRVSLTLKGIHWIHEGRDWQEDSCQEKGRGGESAISSTQTITIL